MRQVSLPGCAAAALLAVLLGLPGSARARSCGDPDAVSNVLRLLSDRLGLTGVLSLTHIRRAPSDPVTGGPTCEADIEGITDPPTIYGRALDAVRYWDETTPDAAGTPSVGARLLPRGAPLPPDLTDAAGPAR
jgi:hypothetical protein